MNAALQNFAGTFRILFNTQSEKAKGRVIALTSTLLTTVYNVFISGVFYTGFLTKYGMSITDTGILTFMPLLANVLSAFSPMILKRFPKRKWLLLGVRLAYYALYIVAITLMPQFVQDTGARLVWFAVLSTTATAMYSLFGNGFTVWLYNFYPEDNNLRVKYLAMANLLYMNLPEEKATTHITFHAIGINVFAFLGLLAGTCISNIGGGEPMLIMGRTVYGVQFTCVLTSSQLLMLGLLCLLRWRSFTCDGEISRIEQAQRMRVGGDG